MAPSSFPFTCHQHRSLVHISQSLVSCRTVPFFTHSSSLEWDQKILSHLQEKKTEIQFWKNEILKNPCKCWLFPRDVCCFVFAVQAVPGLKNSALDVLGSWTCSVSCSQAGHLRCCRLFVQLQNTPPFSHILFLHCRCSSKSVYPASLCVCHQLQ